MNDVEARWVEQARQLLHDDDHIRRCDLLLGAEAVARADAPDLRWPGYLGARYRPGGLLLTATVHHDFASGSPPLPVEEKDRLITATRRWRDGALDDETWLRTLRSVYSTGLAHHWTAGKLLRALARRVGLGVEDVAYVNAARCQVVETAPTLPDRSRIISDVVHLCARRYPVARTAEVIGAGAVVMSKGTYDAAGADVPRGVPLLVVDQRQLCLRAPLDHGGATLPAKTPVDVWAPVLGAILAGR